jgi:hypothetical protein
MSSVGKSTPSLIHKLSDFSGSTRPISWIKIFCCSKEGDAMEGVKLIVFKLFKGKVLF